MKKNVFTRLACLALAVMLCATALAGCGGNSATTGGGAATTAPQPSTAPSTAGSAPTGPAAGTVLYTVTAKGQGGMLLSGVTVALTDAAGSVVASGVTDENGSYQAWLAPAEYTVDITDGLRDGYTPVQSKTTAEGGAFDVIANTAVITDKYPQLVTKSYDVGDVMYDFSFVNNAGETVRLSELLETKKLVVINFWATWCGPCKKEFPAMQEAYEAYGDEVEIVAFSTSDTVANCDKFRNEQGYTFNMIPDIGLYGCFSVFSGGGAIPTTVMVDRYGVIVDGTAGYVDSAAVWKAEMGFYTSDDYNQTGEVGNVDPVDPGENKPNVEMPASDKIEAAVNGAGFKGTYTASSGELIWPWVVGEDGKSIEPSNYGKHDTSAYIHTTIDMKAGEVFAFDYEYAIDHDEYGAIVYDAFVVYVDGYKMQTMFKKQDGKVTCYAYTPVADGTHTISLAYIKDSNDDYLFEEEYLRVSNIRLVSVEDMTAAGGSVDVITDAANTVADENAPTSYVNYVDVVLGEDGYYHVGTADGPLLLTQLNADTAWGTSLYTYAQTGGLKINGIDYSDRIVKEKTRSYCWLESYSTLGYSVVDEKLADLLDFFAANVGDGKNHDKEWLEFCSYFIHYGVGDGVTKITDVRQGIDKASAFEAVLGENRVDINQTIVPIGWYFKFVPEQSGVYKFYSTHGYLQSSATSDFSTEAWFWTDETVLDDIGQEVPQDESELGSSKFVLYENLTAGKTYYISVAFGSTDDLGHFYFNIDYIGADDGSVDRMVPCTSQFTADLTTGEMCIYRNYDFHAALGEDGYYHQILGYDADGKPILDMSEHGYVYVDFLNVSDMTQFIAYSASAYATLEKLITVGYGVHDENGKIIQLPNAFDFTSRTDIKDAQWREELGNHQAEMEAYLAEALSGEKTDFDYGYVKADEKLVHILNDLISLHGEGLVDEWLMFCSFAKHPTAL